MKEIKYFCDICGKEFPPKEFSFLNGVIFKIDAQLKAHGSPFEGHYCGEDTKQIIEFIEELSKKHMDKNFGKKKI